MKLTAHEEYGLRCLLQVGKGWPDSALTIPEVSKREGISVAHAAKLLQILRQGGFLKSVRGQIGGYSLASPPEKILVRDVLGLLGGRIYEDEFCQEHKGRVRLCTHSTDCAIRSLWRSIRFNLSRIPGSQGGLRLASLRARHLERSPHPSRLPRGECYGRPSGRPSSPLTCASQSL